MHVRGTPRRLRTPAGCAASEPFFIGDNLAVFEEIDDGASRIEQRERALAIGGLAHRAERHETAFDHGVVVVLNVGAFDRDAQAARSRRVLKDRQAGVLMRLDEAEYPTSETDMRIPVGTTKETDRKSTTL